MEQNTNGYGLGIASFVLGLGGLIIALFINGPVGLVLGIVGLVLATMSKRAGYRGGLRTAGFVLSLLALILGVVMLVITIAAYFYVRSVIRDGFGFLF